MSTIRSRARRAFTLVEILVAVVILGIVGGALVKLIISQSRFTEKQIARRNSRTVSRNAMNIMLTDLRMTQDVGGLLAAGRQSPVSTAPNVMYDSVVVRVPIAFGLYCGQASSDAVLSLLPVDSAMTALGYYGGYAIRDSATQNYSYADVSNPVPFSSVTTLPLTNTFCSNALLGGPGITQVTYNGSTGKIVTLAQSLTGPKNAGWPAFMYQQITYIFQPSATYAGRIGLFRKIKTGPSSSANAYKVDEIIAPFDTSAGFRYYVLNEDTAQVAPPASLAQVRGLQLYLAGSSPSVPVGEQAAQAALVTGVFFKNRRDP
jgi:prepilin-type N-terminal cleavage/methylation domain-containing protein